MTERERMHELHLCLDGAVDQLAAAQRIAVAGEAPGAWTERIERALAEVARLRNDVRDQLLNTLGRPPSG